MRYLINAAAFGEICAAAGLPALTYRGEIGTPAVPVTSAKLRAAGFAFRPLSGTTQRTGRTTGGTRRPWPVFTA